MKKISLEAPGFEPGAFRMRSGHSTTELCPLDDNDDMFWFNWTITKLLTYLHHLFGATLFPLLNLHIGSLAKNGSVNFLKGYQNVEKMKIKNLKKPCRSKWRC